MYVRLVFEDERVANSVFEGTGNVDPCGQIGQLRCYITRSFFLGKGQRDQGSLSRFFFSAYTRLCALRYVFAFDKGRAQCPTEGPIVASSSCH